MTNPQTVEATEAFIYSAPTRVLRDWLRAQPTLVDLVGQRVYASVFPKGCPLPAVAFHRTPGTIVDRTVEHASYQFDCEAANPGSDSPLGAPELAERLAAVVASILMSTPARTRLGPGVVLEGAEYIDSFFLPEPKSGVPRQVLLARLSFAGY